MSDVSMHVIARAVIVANDLILVTKHREHANTFLPGGHVEPGESCLTTLQREFVEELGVRCVPGRYLGVIENRWWDTDIDIWHHELNHYFIAHSPDLTPGVSPPGLEPHSAFFWARLTEFERHNLLPIPLRTLIAGWQDGDERVWWGSTL